ncbi:MAG: secondary thiamine-phosphate synthase enzyme YjbQ [Chloroflexota bacterium]|nr:secondary thiamine-phosphate synthase enzyme YjbQ [Chloroflexota bacterium]
METPVIAPHANFHASSLRIRTTRSREFFDITDEVLERVADSGVRNGLAVVVSRHTTAAIVVNEHEPELLKDLDVLLSEIASEGREYAHNAVPCGPGEQPNGHAHCQALLLNASTTVPVVDGRAELGRYQRIFLIELDCARPREVTIILLGL